MSDCGIGHGIGLYNQEAPSITPLFSFESPVILEEGMAVALETFYGSKLWEYPRLGAPSRM
jgi:hypothetical protein